MHLCIEGFDAGYPPESCERLTVVPTERTVMVRDLDFQLYRPPYESPHTGICLPTMVDPPVC